MTERIYGSYTTKRGIRYQYEIREDGYIEVWKPAHIIPRRGVGGYTMGEEKYVNATNELLDYVLEKHGIKAWDFGKQGMRRIERNA